MCVASRAAAEDEKPIRALLVLGGCCHDYKEQQKLLTEGISARANVQWEISYDPDTGTKHLNPRYEKEDWASGFDVVVHDECTSDVKDIKAVQRILKPHRDGLPAVVLHCGIHSYRTEGYPKNTPWFEFTGLASTGHGPQAPIEIAFVEDDHPITQGLTNWKTANEELYNNFAGKLHETASPLARGQQVWTNRDGSPGMAEGICVWTNRYNGKTRVFATTLGHNNVTVGDPRYLDLVTRGLLWSVDKLDEAHLKPAAQVLISDVSQEAAPGDAQTKGKSIKNSVGMTLVRVPAGEFVMGAADSEKGMTYNEQPQHRVRITKPFYLGTHEVTQAEWTAVMRRNPSWFMPGGDGADKVKGLDTRRFPVEMVTWFDAVQYCNSLSEREELPPYYAIENVRREEGSIRSADVSIPSASGRGYRLPTEAEWEYACRAGTTTPFHFGSVANGSEENIDGAYPPYVTKRKGEPLQRPTTVGKYKANAFGLHDMHGNVREWCYDGWAQDAYVGRRGTITSDPVVDTGDERVMRGGSWPFDGDFCRSAARSRVLPRIPSGETGLRVARNP